MFIHSFIPSRTHYLNKQFFFLSNKFCSFSSVLLKMSSELEIYIYRVKKIFIFLIFLLVKHHQIQPNIILKLILCIARKSPQWVNPRNFPHSVYIQSVLKEHESSLGGLCSMKISLIVIK